MLVLTGAGGEAFCAGADLKALDLDVDHPDGPMGFTRLTPSKPAIAAIDGWCLAGGLELALWCDLRIATPGSTFGLFERRWGVPLVDGGTQRLPRVVGMGRALELILTGRPVDAEEALRIGLVNEVVAPGAHLERALELAERIASFPQETMLADRRAAIEGAGLPLAEGLALEHRLGRETLDVAVEGAARFAAGEGRGGGAGRLNAHCTARRSRREAITRPHLVLGRFGADVRHQHREHQVGQDAAQLGAAPGADLVEDHRGGAADREAGGVGRQLLALRGDGAALLEEVGEPAQRRPVADRARPRRRRSPRPSPSGRCRARRPAGRPGPAARRRSGLARAGRTLPRRRSRRGRRGRR